MVFVLVLLVLVLVLLLLVFSVTEGAPRLGGGVGRREIEEWQEVEGHLWCSSSDESEDCSEYDMVVERCTRKWKRKRECAKERRRKSREGRFK
jgi:hypothetical protein